MDSEEGAEQVQQAPGPSVDSDMADITAQEYSTSFVPRPVETLLEDELLEADATAFAGHLGSDSENDGADHDIEADSDSDTESDRDVQAFWDDQPGLADLDDPSSGEETDDEVISRAKRKRRRKLRRLQTVSDADDAEMSQRDRTCAPGARAAV